MNDLTGLGDRFNPVGSSRSSGKICIEGGKCVAAALASDRFTVRKAVFEENRHLNLLATAQDQRVACEVISAEEMAEKAGYPFHRGVFAFADRPVADLNGISAWKKVVALYHIADEGNLGTIIRTSAGFGADAVIIPKGKGGDPFSRKSIRSSAGAIFSLPVYESSDFVGDLLQMREAGFSAVGAALGQQSIPLKECICPKRSIILFGAEKDGLPEEIEKQCDVLVEIPMARNIDSLNVAGSSAIFLYELWSD